MKQTYKFIYLSIFGACCFFLLSFLAAFQTNLINSDSLTSPVLINDLFHDHFSISGWSIAPSPAFFSETLLFLISGVTGMRIEAQFGLVTLLQSLCLWVAFLVFLINSYPKMQFKVAVLGTLLVLLGLAGSIGKSNFVLFVARNNMHMGALFFGLIYCNQLVVFRDKVNWKRLLAVFLVAFLGSVDGKIFVLSALAPGLATFLLLSLFETERKMRLKIFLSIAAVSYLGFRASEQFLRALSKHSALGAYAGHSTEGSLRSLQVFWDSVIAAFTVQDNLSRLVVFLFSLGCMYSLVWIVQDFRRSRNLSSSFVPILFLGSAAAETIVVIWMARFHYVLYEFRYFMLPISIGIFIGGLALLKIRNKVFRSGIALIFLLCLFDSLKGFPTSGSLTDYNMKNLSACLDLNKSKYTLHFGLSDYWGSKTLTYLSESDLRIYAVDDNLNRYHWMNNKNWYLGQTGSRFESPFYNFIVVNRNWLSKEAISAKFGPPSEVFECSVKSEREGQYSDKPIEVLVYQSDSLDKLLKAKLMEDQ